ncbi:MAG: S9 family peptidase [Candidatus Heimdallarchaeota archaeon]|nr:S9 family peptidase [Candidatus Heimdallarchaeota archaeon]
MASEKIEIKDYLKIKRVSGINVSQNYVFWVEQLPSVKDEGYQSSISRYEKSSGKMVQFTSGFKSDYSPKSSKDESKLAFLSTRAKEPQIFVMCMNGGEAVKLTSAKGGVNSVAWSPDSAKIVFQAKWKVEDDKKEDEPDKSPEEIEIEDIREKHAKKNLADPLVITNLIYKTGTDFIDSSRKTQIFILNVETKKVERISTSEFDYGVPSWLDNTTVLAYVKNEENPDLAVYDNLVSINVGTKVEEHIYRNYNPYIFFADALVNQHDNSQVLVPVLEEGYSPAQDSQLHKLGFLRDGKHEIINKELDRSVVRVCLTSKDGGLMQIDSDGFSRVVQYTMDGNKFDPLYEPDFSIQTFDAITTEEFYASGTNPDHPSAIWKWSKNNGVQLIYDPNTDFLHDKTIVMPQEFWFTNPDGVKFQCWLMEADLQNGSRPPLILSIHGGPHMMWDNAGSMWHEWQSQLAAGYSILACNPVGSDGYGEKFLRNVGARWGRDDARDLLLVVDKLVTDGKVDPDNLFLCGGSYAGYQVAHIITFDHRFNAGCAQRGVYNLTNLEAGSDLARFGISEYDGPVWDNLDKLWDHSPVSRVRDVQTPLLIIHSESDYRVPIAQADEMFNGLRVHQKKVKYVRYPRDGHELSRSGEPLHVIDRLVKMMEWFEEHKK